MTQGALLASSSFASEALSSDSSSAEANGRKDTLALNEFSLMQTVAVAAYCSALCPQFWPPSVL